MTQVSAEDLLAAAERRAARAERAACAGLVCLLCGEGEVPLLDARRSRMNHVAALRSALRAAEIRAESELRAEALTRQHRRWCAVCRDGDAELCAGLGAAYAADLFRDHLRSCRGPCRSRGGRTVVCSEGARLRAAMRSAACLAAGIRRRTSPHLQEIEDLDFPSEYFHVTAVGQTLRCPASAIWLRGPTPERESPDVRDTHTPGPPEART